MSDFEFPIISTEEQSKIVQFIFRLQHPDEKGWLKVEDELADNCIRIVNKYGIRSICTLDGNILSIDYGDNFVHKFDITMSDEELRKKLDEMKQGK